MKLNKGWGVAAIVLGFVALVSAANEYFQPMQHFERQMEAVGEEFGEQFGEGMSKFGQNFGQAANQLSRFAVMDDAHTIKQSETMTIKAEKVKKLVLDNQVGKIRIIASPDAKEITVNYIKKLNLGMSETETQAHFDEIKIKTENKGDTSQIKTELISHLTNGFNRMAGVDYELTVPANVAVEIKNNVGEVITIGLQGTVDVQLDIGKIDINGFKDSLKLRNNTGEVNVRGGQAINKVEASTNIGAINLYLPSDASLKVDARTDIGNIETSFNLDTDKEMPGARTHGQIGAGKGSLKLTTNTGPINIRQE